MNEASVPTGWRLVPIKPTEAMCKAGGHANSEWLNDNAPLGEARYATPIPSVWADMLRAIPAHSEHPAEPVPLRKVGAGDGNTYVGGDTVVHKQSRAQPQQPLKVEAVALPGWVSINGHMHTIEQAPQPQQPAPGRPARLAVPVVNLQEVLMLVDPPPMALDGFQHEFVNANAAEVLDRLRIAVRRMLDASATDENIAKLLMSSKVDAAGNPKPVASVLEQFAVQVLNEIKILSDDTVALLPETTRMSIDAVLMMAEQRRTGLGG